MSDLPTNDALVRRRGAVAVIERQGTLLVIRRSQTVVAPGAFCFPGGGIEAGESEPQALVRELQEELQVVVRPVRRLWSSVTPWRVELAWWQAELAADAVPVPAPAEVESVHWHTPGEIAGLPGLLESNLQFLAALARNEFALSVR
ncbi:MAG TPA: NUDIX domain-containing protein [Pirellulales bacterium]|nr:NUDIX domain-containing protein [Pirellulales bacterium]